MKQLPLPLALWICTLVASCAPPHSPADQNSGPDSGTSATYPALPSLDLAIYEEMEAAQLPGVSACIIKGGVIAWCGAYGYANIEEQRKVTIETPFLVASVSKLVAAAGIMHVWEQESLNLDAPVSSLLPFPIVHPAFPESEITTRMLMTHHAGIRDNWDVLEELYTDGDPAFTLESFLRDYLTAEGTDYNGYANFGAQPGASYDYSNVGAALAAYVAEAVTGEDFATYCETNIFAELGLKHTAWSLAGLDVDEIAVPYEVVGGSYKPIDHYGFPDYPSGQLRSSAEDLAKFFAMLINDGSAAGIAVLKPTTLAEMKRVQMPGNEDQAMIWYYSMLDGEQLLGHDGGELGASAEIQMRTSDDVGVVVMMNGEGQDSTNRKLMRALFAAADSL